MLKLLMNKNIKYNHQFPKEQNKKKIFERTSVTISLKEQNKN